MRLKRQNKIRKPITVRFSDEELKKVREKSMAYTEGRLAEWIRYAAINCIPNKRDVVFDDPKPKKKRRRN